MILFVSILKADFRGDHTTGDTLTYWLTDDDDDDCYSIYSMMADLLCWNWYWPAVLLYSDWRKPLMMCVFGEMKFIILLMTEEKLRKVFYWYLYSKQPLWWPVTLQWWLFGILCGGILLISQPFDMYSILDTLMTSPFDYDILILFDDGREVVMMIIRWFIRSILTIFHSMMMTWWYLFIHSIHSPVFHSDGGIWYSIILTIDIEKPWPMIFISRNYSDDERDIIDRYSWRKEWWLFRKFVDCAIIDDDSIHYLTGQYSDLRWLTDWYRNWNIIVDWWLEVVMLFIRWLYWLLFIRWYSGIPILEIDDIRYSLMTLSSDYSTGIILREKYWPFWNPIFWW